jgi:hypothetical protein
MFCYFIGMSTPTPEEIRDAVAGDLLTGDAERQIGDRRVRKEDPVKRLQAARELSSDNSPRGPFVRIGFLFFKCC